MLNKKELIGNLAEKLGTSKAESERVLTGVLESIADTLVSGDGVKISGFGAFSVKSQPARERRNPATGETFMAPASKKIVFKPASDLKVKI